MCSMITHCTFVSVLNFFHCVFRQKKIVLFFYWDLATLPNIFFKFHTKTARGSVEGPRGAFICEKFY